MSHTNVTCEYVIHTNLCCLQSYTDIGLATGMPPGAVDDLKWFLATCAESRIKVLLSLWSHDMLGVRR
jgi:hypothetical protein